VLLNYESDENFSFSSDLQLVNFDINKSHDITEEKNNLEEDIHSVPQERVDPIF